MLITIENGVISLMFVFNLSPLKLAHRQKYRNNPYIYRYFPIKSKAIFNLGQQFWFSCYLYQICVKILTKVNNDVPLNNQINQQHAEKQVHQTTLTMHGGENINDLHNAFKVGLISFFQSMIILTPNCILSTDKEQF